MKAGPSPRLPRKPTFVVVKRPQSLAAAWLRDAREWRPARDVLNAGDEIGPELRAALAEWMSLGSKRARRRGAKVPRDPWNELPPSFMRGLPTTQKEQQAGMLFCAYAMSHGWIAAAISNGALLPRRGRPLAFRQLAAKYVAAKLNVSVRTAQKWFTKFGPKISAYRDLTK